MNTYTITNSTIEIPADMTGHDHANKFLTEDDALAWLNDSLANGQAVGLDPDLFLISQIAD